MTLSCGGSCCHLHQCLLATLELLGSIPDGPAREFDENGLLRAESQYKDNHLDGEFVRYDEKGRTPSCMENGRPIFPMEARA